MADDTTATAPAATAGEAPTPDQATPEAAPAPAPEAAIPAPFDWSSVPDEAWRSFPTDRAQRLRRENPEVGQWWKSEVGREATTLAEQKAIELAEKRAAALIKEREDRELEERILSAPDEEAGRYLKQQTEERRAEATRAAEHARLRGEVEQGLRGEIEQATYSKLESEFRTSEALRLDAFLRNPAFGLTEADQDALWKMAETRDADAIRQAAVRIATERSVKETVQREIRGRTETIEREARAAARGEEPPLETTAGSAPPPLTYERYEAMSWDERQRLRREQPGAIDAMVAARARAG